MGLGMFDFGIPYVSQSLTINPEDKLFLYTDGIPEAMNAKNEEYSEEKMISFLIASYHCSVKESLKHLLTDIKDFAQGIEQSDDITALILKRNK
jgi:serine phosphatase RsbU (regulator of sigma subunit)